MASFAPGQRSRSFAILGVAGLRLRLQNHCGLDLNLNLPFLDGHYVVFVFKAFSLEPLNP